MLSLAAFCRADFAKDIITMAEKADNDTANVFKEDHVGFDLHADVFYYVDSRVDQQYKASAYQTTRVVMGGQDIDIGGREVRPSLYPFVVGMKSYTQFRSHLNRFDVRDNGEYQYVGLYAGDKNSFVVNKLRAHLLREVANSITHLLPVLDRTASPDAINHPNEVITVQKEVIDTIEAAFKFVDENIMQTMKPSDTTSASANVVVITKKYVITASMGAGRVFGYNSATLIDDLNKSDEVPVTFGYAKNKKKDYRPQVSIVPRITYDEEGPKETQLILIETPRAAKSPALSNYNAFNTVLQQIVLHKDKPTHEQEIFSSSVIRMLDMVHRTTRFFGRVFGGDNDAAICLISLTRNYGNIH